MKHASHDYVAVTIEDGTTVKAAAPLIVSASRATDIPALFGPWFMQALEKGYTRRINPFNGKTHYVSFKKTSCIVFWSKNPAPFLPYLDTLDKKGIGYFFHFTLNNYEEYGLEANLPPLDHRIATVAELSERIGRNKVLWRFDPLILSKEIGPDDLLRNIENIGDQIAPFISRLTVSFLSPYRAVLRRMHAHGIHPHDPSPAAIEHIAVKLDQLSKKWGMAVQSCAERFDLEPYGILRGCCIDPVYLAENFPEQPTIRELVDSYRIANIFEHEDAGLRRTLKDPGQRPLCGCMISKDVGRYGTCTHGCVYCYADCRGSRLR
jgi:hypothetical protein